ncbi:MAG TPA: hypothetical protein VLK82_17745 [Candidatus Tectomicrobia bacterium]|nr:hypothetical protein [Candidatus Tectomicrobia bacterium]
MRTRPLPRALHQSPIVRELLEGRLALEWAPTRLVSDDPAKGLGLAAPATLLLQKLQEIMGEPAAEIELVSAYFVLTATDRVAVVSCATPFMLLSGRVVPAR